MAPFGHRYFLFRNLNLYYPYHSFWICLFFLHDLFNNWLVKVWIWDVAPTRLMCWELGPPASGAIELIGSRVLTSSINLLMKSSLNGLLEVRSSCKISITQECAFPRISCPWSLLCGLSASWHCTTAQSPLWCSASAQVYGSRLGEHRLKSPKGQERPFLWCCSLEGLHHSDGEAGSQSIPQGTEHFPALHISAFHSLWKETDKLVAISQLRNMSSTAIVTPSMPHF